MAALLRFSVALPSAVLICLLVVGIGVLDEIQKMHIPGPESSSLDLLPDAICAAIAIVVIVCLQRYIRVRD